MEIIDYFSMAVIGIFTLMLLPELVKTIKIVPQQQALIIERLGRYHTTLLSGVHILFPFLDRISFKIDLKEESIDVPPQECFTTDEIRVIVDGIIYLQVNDAFKAAYGVTNYRWAAMQLAQTTTRSAIGKLSLDGTFEAREQISREVVSVLKSATALWGIDVRLYEIKNIKPPESVQASMEKFMRAERERKAIIAKSSGQRQALINKSEGYSRELINRSEGDMTKAINEASGKASEIMQIADAIGESIEKVAAAIKEPYGASAVKLELVDKYLGALGTLGTANADIVLPMDISNWQKLTETVLGRLEDGK